MHGKCNMKHCSVALKKVPNCVVHDVPLMSCYESYLIRYIFIGSSELDFVA